MLVTVIVTAFVMNMEKIYSRVAIMYSQKIGRV